MLLLPPSGRLLFTAAIALQALSGCAGSPSANAQDVASEQQQFSAERTIGADDIDAAVAEASRRSGIPEDWIRAVIRAESAGDPLAVSSKGAMGLMQIMPGTWAELRAQYSLGEARRKFLRIATWRHYDALTKQRIEQRVLECAGGDPEPDGPAELLANEVRVVSSRRSDDHEGLVCEVADTDAIAFRERMRLGDDERDRLAPEG